MSIHDRGSWRTAAAAIVGVAALADAATGTLRAAPPARIVSLSVCVDEILFRIADRSAIASLTAQAANPGYSTIAGKIGGVRLNNGRAEEVARMNPDLVIGDRFNARTTVHVLRRMKFRVETVPYAATAAAIRQNIRFIAGLVGREKRGLALIEGFDKALTRYRQPAGGRRFRIIFYQARGFVPGIGTLADAAMSDAGVVNGARRLGVAGVGQISLEQLVVARPQAIVLVRSIRNAPSVARGSLSHPALRLLGKERVVTTMPSNLLICGGPAYTEAVRRLAMLRQRLAARHGE